jgi:hypothetical protein
VEGEQARQDRVDVGHDTTVIARESGRSSASQRCSGDIASIN